MSKPNNHNNIDRMKMAVRSEFETQDHIHFDDLYRAVVNPMTDSGFFFVLALEEMIHAGELTQDKETFSKDIS